MKKLLLTLVVALAFGGSIFAQQTHWPDFNLYNFPFNLPVVGFVQIDGEYVTSANYADMEIGAFVDGECRGHMFMTDYTEDGDPYPIFEISIYYPNGENAPISFVLFDHSTGTEYTDCTPSFEVLTAETHVELYFDYDEALVLNFAAAAAESYTLEIDPYSGDKDNYYLIASPVGAVAANVVEGLRTPDFDFFSFDQEGDDEGKEWINLRDDEVYELQPGMGYLYANNTGTDLTFTGSPVATGNFDIELYKAENSDWPGWNLVGNPLAETAYVGREFYRMSRNEQGSELIEANGAIEAMEGVFVIAAENGEILTFTTTEPGKTAKLALNLIGTSTVIDRAVVNFGQGGQLPKFQINSNSTKLYIPMGDQDYAVVSCGEMGELPVNFKAERSGSYTIAVSSEEVSFGYLHLIDNLTGADVDLLANPSYSFDANTTDYASRFRLVFATGNADDTFAFFNNGSFVVSNEGEAMLQVVDVTGRILSSETINGCASVNIDAAPGVYMIRLSNGDSTKVQKVVVK